MGGGVWGKDEMYATFLTHTHPLQPFEEGERDNHDETSKGSEMLECKQKGNAASIFLVFRIPSLRQSRKVIE